MQRTRNTALLICTLGRPITKGDMAMTTRTYAILATAAILIALVGSAGTAEPGKVPARITKLEARDVVAYSSLLVWQEQKSRSCLATGVNEKPFRRLCLGVEPSSSGPLRASQPTGTMAAD